MRRLAAAMAALLMMMIGCGRSPETAPAAGPLRVAAASDLRSVLPRLLERFEAKSKVRVEASFGASGQLAQQVRQGAPFDIFLSANRKFVADLAADGAVRAGTVRDYALGTLVLAVHEASASKIASLADLADPSIRHVALANPDLAPYGVAGKQALGRAKLWDVIAPKLAQAETVAQAMQFVRTGNAEAGLVGRSIAHVKGVKVVTIDPALYDPIVQALGVVSASRMSEEAEAFARFVLSDEGQAVLSEAGFGPLR